MKKLFAIVVAVTFLATFSFAQNTATVTDNGSNNGAFIQQVGHPNTATITQTGDFNKANVGDHYASSLFGVLSSAKGISQTGTNNTGTITQTNLFSGTVLAGPEAGIGQFSNGNTATITQSHNSAYMQEYAWAQQQSGNGNTSLQNQVSGYQFSHVLQSGNTNNAETQQLGGYGQKANILQSGDGNDAYQWQGTAGYTETNLAEATQINNNNESKQYQYGSTNTAKVIQEVGDNVAWQTQNGNGNTATAWQFSGNNTSKVTQTATSNHGNTVFTEQWDGTGNKINLDQTAGSSSNGLVNIYQDGAGNIVQGLDANILGISHDGSTLNVYQGYVGNLNVLHLYQINGASATVSQFGSSNNAVVNQQ